ncbi:MAG TPA: NAD(P)-dependent oxidoreductase [Polyangiaceae bacterium]|jgi:nucleoside-diphosphate-sugar epimerase|nr:NAD(P)-dependent oxidoreductase [Polyangiaceae bacterium]
MTILVTGGSGFLGSHVVEQLSQAGRAVRALVRKSSDTKFLRTLPNVELFDGAIDDRASLERAVEGVEAVVHSAGLVKARSLDEFMRVNAQGTEYLLEACMPQQASLKRFVLVSSIAVGGPSDAHGNPVPLDAEPRPVTDYGRSKLAAERAALTKKDQLKITILRPPAIYGPRDREILAFFKSIKLGVLPLLGSPQSKLSMTFGPDCARACIRAIDAEVPSGSIFAVDDGSVHTMAELISEAESAVGKRAFLRIPLPRRVVEGAAFMSEAYGKVTNRAVMLTRDKCNELFDQWVCDSSNTQRALDWTPSVTFSQGVKRTVDWYRQAGWL